jgi:hypothetical protein
MKQCKEAALRLEGEENALSLIYTQLEATILSMSDNSYKMKVEQMVYEHHSS